MSVGHLGVFLAEVSTHVFCPFLHWIICFLGVEFDKFFIDVGTNPLSGMWFANIFSHPVNCLLVLLIVSFAVQKLFILMRSQYFIFVNSFLITLFSLGACLFSPKAREIKAKMNYLLGPHQDEKLLHCKGNNQQN